MKFNEEAFLQRYTNLNDQQKKAVDTIYGPVMVIAGPGTGKTEVLSMRIANLLRSDAQVQPHEILCLTYTDEATNSMRRRLVQIIGSAAHKVNICTFHGFCNNVIQANSDYFSLRALQPITDLERTELLYELLDELPQGHPLRKLSGNIYFDVGRLNRLFDLMKRENLRPSDIVAAVDAYLEDIPNREQYIYKRNGKGFKAGDIKQSLVDEEKRRMEVTRAAAELFDPYTAKMKDKGRYDFNDMIIWVLDAFKSNPALLLSYQERHQFILVDEFQDTNGSQNEVLKVLAEFWEDPNIFVVGDDDQSIYEFQGARIKNIIEFYDRYKDNIKVIVLPQNYRSSQAILDKATQTIINNKERLIHQLQDLNLDKNIVAAHPRFLEEKEMVAPVVKGYSNILHEEADIILQIEKLQSEGVTLRNIAIIYAQHKQADNIIALMERKGIPYSVKKPVNILDTPLVDQIITLLRYLHMERLQPFGGEALLFELMHAPYYGIAATDIALLSIYIQHNKHRDKSLGFWRLLLANDLLLESLSLRDAKALRRLGQNIDNWLGNQMTLPLPLLVEKIIYESGIVAHILQGKDHVWNSQILHSFFTFVKDSFARNNKLKPAEFLSMIDKMNDERISLPVQKVVQNDNGVHLYTAHGSKGNEFEYVFLIGCTKNFWENKKGAGNEYKLPDTITLTNDDAEKTYKTEVARRLFYVALTRAKKYLQVSYAVKDNDGKELETSSFVDEISQQEERSLQTVSTPELINHMAWAMTPVPDVKIELANHQYIERCLQQMAMSPSTLSKYLKCPVTFYYENILRVPFLKGDALAFGSAVHFALEKMFVLMKDRKGQFPAIEEVLNAFDTFMHIERDSFTPSQFERRTEQGHQAIVEYCSHYLEQFSTNVEIELKVPRYSLDGIPITGKIDKLEIEGESCVVIDYKTGDPDKSAKAYTAAPNEKEPLGGDYWRQMVFYKILLENWPDKDYKVSMGMFDYVEKGRISKDFKRVYVPVFVQDEEIVRAQLRDSWSRIMNHEFDKGCNKPECHWCNFAKRYELVRPVEEALLEAESV